MRRAGARLGTALMIVAASAAAVAGVAGAPGNAGAQIFGPQVSPWGPRVDSAFVTAATRSAWRGYVVGGPDVGAGLDVALYGRPVTTLGAWGASATAHGFRALDARSAALVEGRLAAALEVARWLGLGEARVGLVGGGYVLPWDDAHDGGAELGLALRALPVPWPGELWPTLDLEVARDFGAFDGAMAHAALHFLPGVGPFALLLRGEAWADEWLDDGFRFRAWQATVGLSLDIGVLRRRAQPGGAGEGPNWRVAATGFVLDPRGPARPVGGAGFHVSLIP